MENENETKVRNTKRRQEGKQNKRTKTREKGGERKGMEGGKRGKKICLLVG